MKVAFEKNPALKVIESLWSHPSVTDVQFFIPTDSIYPQRIFYFKDGQRLVLDHPLIFKDVHDATQWVNELLKSIHKHFDPASREGIFEVLPNGDRLHVIHHGVGYSAMINKKFTFVPCLVITLRRTTKTPWNQSELRISADEMAKGNFLRASNSREQKELITRHTNDMTDPATLDFLKIMVDMGKNYIISGNAGSGKTVLAQNLLSMIPIFEVPVVIEEVPEIQSGRFLIRCYETETSKLADRIRDAFRMYPDRLFISELRNEECAYQFLQALSAGYGGCSATIHASAAPSAINRLINLVTCHKSASHIEIIRENTFQFLNFVIHMERIGSSRMIREVIELLPNGTVHTVSKYEQEGFDSENHRPIGSFHFYGPSDSFLKEMNHRGFEVPVSWE